MNRLQRELHRLYGPQSDADPSQPPDLDAPNSLSVDAQGRVRALVLALARPANWSTLAAVWGGVQADLALPAPAIAVDGRDGLQLWFSLLQPVPAPQAGAFLDALRRRYLGDVAPARVALLPTGGAALAGPPTHAQPVPAEQAGSGRWSAFVASDLAAMFADEPWLDMPPNPDGQAQLLAPLKSITPGEFEGALQQLRLVAMPTAVAAPLGLPSRLAPQAAASVDPKRFLLDVMNNESLDLALRIEAAKALLPYADADRLA